ncbi:MAG TPA: hypothetical protein VHF07_09225, partial [Nitrospiraceae bacterium]|nr:hypothetical protein [Nitrospiraceae bacterium]
LWRPMASSIDAVDAVDQAKNSSPGQHTNAEDVNKRGFYDSDVAKEHHGKKRPGDITAASRLPSGQPESMKWSAMT